MVDIDLSSNRDCVVRSGPYSVDCGPGVIDMKLNPRPRRDQRDNDRQLPADELLLMVEPLIHRDYELVAVCLGAVTQFPVQQARPASFESRVDVVLPQVPAEGCR